MASNGSGIAVYLFTSKYMSLKKLSPKLVTSLSDLEGNLKLKKLINYVFYSDAPKYIDLEINSLINICIVIVLYLK